MMLSKIVIGFGAFLLFLVQPMIAKYILPFFGGGASVWNVSLLFFMSALFLGYLYAYHVVTRHVRTHRFIHGLVVLFVAGLMVIEMLVGEGISPIMTSTIPMDAHPIGSIVWFLCMSIGLPYVLLATTSILVQKWAAEHHRDPYQLYGASNLGSFGAIILYPFLFEMTTPLSVQGWWWSGGFLVYCGLLLTLMMRTMRPKKDILNGDSTKNREQQHIPSHLARILWVSIAALSSVILLSTTLVATQGISAGPFSWLVPLGLYLLSYTVAFRTWRITTFQFAVRYMIFFCALLLGAIIILLGMLVGIVPFFVPNAFIATVVGLGVTLPFFFVYIHRVLYELRPSVAYLPSFYLWVAAGGALGGFFVNIIAPLIAHIYVEVWVSVFGVVLLIGLYEGLRWLRQDASFQRSSEHVKHLLVGAAIFMCVSVSGATLVEMHHKGAIWYERNFYGALSVREYKEKGDRARTLVNGRIIHGGEVWREGVKSQPRTYYVDTSGIGRVLGIAPGGRSVAILGLGAGEIASYCRAEDEYTFYEIDPAVTRIAREYFTYLSGCDDVRIIHGDARFTLAQGADNKISQKFDVLAVDVFTDDAIPVHLVTREAFDLYESRLTNDGVLAIHISNSFLDLLPVMQSAAIHLQKKLVIIDNTEEIRAQYDGGNKTEKTASLWAIFVDQADTRYDAYHSERKSKSLDHMWTDEYSSLFQIIQW